jgi:cytoskeletal protein CcmA (bactofilin family)
MARRAHDDALGVSGAETIIGAGVVVHGNLTGEADIFIDGHLEGNIKTAGDVTVGINASIKANIEATNVTVAGSLTGNIAASGDTTIRETGHVQGDIKSSGLAIASGGVFIGRSLMEAPPAAVNHPAPDFTKTKRSPTKPVVETSDNQDTEA